MADYSKSTFAKGIVCFNTNNYTKCVVVDGNKGTSDDKCSLVIENFSSKGLGMNNVPNRALIPTGEFIDISAIEKLLDISTSEFKEKVFGD